MNMQESAQGASGEWAQRPRGVVTADRATGNLIQLHLGGFAVCCLALGGMMMEWFDYTTATSMVVMFGLMLSMGYGFQAVRFHRTNPHEPVSNRFKVVSTLLGVAAGACIIKIMYNAGPLAVSCAMIALLYVFFVYLSVLMTLRQPRLMWMVAVNALCGILGWGMIGLFALQMRVRYVFTLTEPAPGIMRTIMERASGIAQMLPAPLLLFAAVILVVAAFFLRIELYHRLSGFDRNRLLVTFHTIAAAFMAMAGLIFLAFSGVAVERKYADALRDAQEFHGVNLQEQEAPVLDFNAEFRGRFQAFAAKWNRAEMDFLQSPGAKFPYRWSSGNVAYLRWRMPADDGTFMRQLLEAENVLRPLYPELDALLAEMPRPAAGVLPNYSIRTFLELTAAWRIRVALVQGDFEAASAAWKQLGAILRDRCMLASPPGTAAVMLNKWADMTEALFNSGKCTREWLLAVQQEARLWNQVLDQPQKPAVAVYLAQFHNCLEQLKTSEELPYPPAYNDISGICPVPRMMVTLEQLLMFRRFENAASWSEIQPGRKGNNSYYTQYMLNVVGEGVGQLIEARNRMASVTLLAAAKHYQLDKGALPENIQLLVPQYIAEIPRDAAGENREFRIHLEKRPVQIFQCSTGYVVQEQRGSFAIRIQDADATAAAFFCE